MVLAEMKEQQLIVYSTVPLIQMTQLPGIPGHLVVGTLGQSVPVVYKCGSCQTLLGTAVTPLTRLINNTAEFKMLLQMEGISK